MFHSSEHLPEFSSKHFPLPVTPHAENLPPILSFPGTCWLHSRWLVSRGKEEYEKWQSLPWWLIACLSIKPSQKWQRRTGLVLSESRIWYLFSRSNIKQSSLSNVVLGIMQLEASLQQWMKVDRINSYLYSMAISH